MVIISSDSDQVHMGPNLLNEEGVDLALQFSEAFVVRPRGEASGHFTVAVPCTISTSCTGVVSDVGNTQVHTLSHSLDERASRAETNGHIGRLAITGSASWAWVEQTFCVRLYVEGGGCASP